MKKSSLSINIKKLRKKNNMSQAKLAEKLHISPQAISKWETGKSLPDMLTLKSLSEIFDVSVDDLISEELGDLKKAKVQEIKKEESDNTKEMDIEEPIPLKSMSTYKKFTGQICLSINFLWLLIRSEFFLYEHPFMQYIILFFCYLGMIYLYSVFYSRYMEQQKSFRWIIVFLNLIIFLIIALIFQQ